MAKRLITNAVRDRTAMLLLWATLAGAVCLLLFGPILGSRLTVGFLTGVFLTVGLGFSLWRYAVRHGDLRGEQAHPPMAQLTAGTDQARLLALPSLQQRLEVGFSNVGSKEGLATLRALNIEWEQLERALQARKATDPLSLGQAAGLAFETYQSGLSALNDALGLLNASGLAERRRLEWEITRLTEDLNARGDQAERQRIGRNTLLLLEQRLRLLGQLQLGADHLVYQARRCEASLQQARVEIAAMRLGSAGERIGSLVEALGGTVQQVKEVQEELKRLGY
ncbi:MAG: hypothetical protein HYY01_07440 [Chloroflexi bacterium]|nr:hypothetical protein [Chloroflexota bacterium]